jgi:serine/threonine protein phosphatase PrpC
MGALSEPVPARRGPPPNGHRFGPLSIGDPGRAATAVVPRRDERFPFRHDIVADTARVGGLDVLGASVRGLSHLYYGVVRQDAFAYRRTRDRRWLVVAVADGVSAGDHSHVAADIVSHTGCDLVAAQLEKRDPADLRWHAILTELAGEIVTRAKQLFGPAPENVACRMAATALFAVVGVEPAESGDRPVHVMSVGDTSAWLLRPDAEPAWQALHEVKNGASVVASSATAALPGMPSRLATPVTTCLRPDEVLVLMSDGVGDPLGHGTGDVGAYLAQAWRRAPDPFTFAAQVGFRRRSYDDDRTVVAVWPVLHSPA